MIIFYSDLVSSTENNKEKYFGNLKVTLRKLLYKVSRAFCFVFVQAFLFSAQLRNNILGTEYGFLIFASVFKYGCENEGLN